MEILETIVATLLVVALVAIALAVGKVAKLTYTHWRDEVFGDDYNSDTTGNRTGR